MQYAVKPFDLIPVGIGLVVQCQVLEKTIASGPIREAVSGGAQVLEIQWA